MSQASDETTKTAMIDASAGSDLEAAVARAAEERAATGATAAGETKNSETPPEGESASAASGDEGSGEDGDEDAPAGAQPGEPTRKKRRRRRKKRAAALDGAEAVEASPDADVAQPTETRADKPRRETALPFQRFFGDGPPRKSPFSPGEIVAGRVVSIAHGVAVIDLFGHGTGFSLENEPRTIPVLEEPAEEGADSAESPPESSEDAAPSETLAGESTVGSVRSTAGVGAPGDEGSALDGGGEETASEAATLPTAPVEPEEAPASVEVSEHPPLEVGAILRARVASVSASGHLALANRVIIRAESRAALAKAREERRRVWGTVYGFNRGGFDVLVEGVRAFCPLSGLSLEPIEDPRTMLGQRLEFSVQAAKPGQQGIVVSRRSLLERELRRRARELRRRLVPGQRVSGVVTGVRDFGFFVDLGEGVEGLVHMSEVSWDRTVKPSDVVKPGDRVEVMVLRVGPPEGRGAARGEGGRERKGDGGRIGLSLKACTPDPWETHAAGIEEGTIRKGKVTRTTEFGAFVELAPGVEGLLHVSELGRDLRHASERVKEGDEVDVVVERVDLKGKRISLSKLTEADRKALEQGGESTLSAQKALRVGAHVKVKVEKVEPAGLHVQVLGVIGRRGRGFIPNAEMGTERGTDHRKKFPPGTEMEVKILGHDRDGGLRLSRKAYHQDEERRAVHDYRREAAAKGFGTFGDLLRSKLQK